MCARKMDRTASPASRDRVGHNRFSIQFNLQIDRPNPMAAQAIHIGHPRSCTDKNRKFYNAFLIGLFTFEIWDVIAV